MKDLAAHQPARLSRRRGSFLRCSWPRAAARPGQCAIAPVQRSRHTAAGTEPIAEAKEIGRRSRRRGLVERENQVARAASPYRELQVGVRRGVSLACTSSHARVISRLISGKLDDEGRLGFCLACPRAASRAGTGLAPWPPCCRRDGGLHTHTEELIVVSQPVVARTAVEAEA